MSKTHTPGPWINHGRILQRGVPHSAVAAKTLIARVYSEAFGDEAQEVANANLIAAAPDMRNALDLYMAHATEPTCAIARHVHAVMLAALRKADGSAT